MPIEVISLLSDEESAPIPPLRKRRRAQPTPTNLVTTSDDEVVIVSHTKRGTNDLTTATQPTRTRAEDEIECVGEQRGVEVLADYPHFRFQCAKLVWPGMGSRGTKRQRYCPRCFCYVCDIPAAECQKWSSHENAHDGTLAWRSKRMEKVEIRKRLERSNNPSQQAYTAFSNPFGTPARSLYGMHAMHRGVIKRRRKAKLELIGAGRRRGRPR